MDTRELTIPIPIINFSPKPWNAGLKYPIAKQTAPIHFEHFSSFIDAVKKEIPQVLEEPRSYDNVVGFFAHWEMGEFASVTDSARNLQNVLDEQYGYDLTEYSIPSEWPESDFLPALSTYVNKANRLKGQTLFILYYGGHATYDHDGEGVLFAYGQEGSPCIKWNTVKSGLEIARCDVLIIFDCCYSTTILDEDFPWKQRCELLGASGAVEETHGNVNNFTQALADFLSGDEAKGGMTVAHIYRRITRKEFVHKYQLHSTPQLKPMTKNPALKSSIFLSPLRKDRGLQVSSSPRPLSPSLSQASTLDGMADETDVRVVMALRFKDSGETPLAAEWLEWFRLRPANIDGIEMALKSQSQLELIGLFDSDSTLAIVSLPRKFMALFFKKTPLFPNILLWGHIFSQRTY
ncbi:hypothetical protein GQ53DRAFT_819518 [Thozetella sp. PMI_491]|nr:hypothetical protein GQ53DRAFT_819518 [Thozetella sp. PMI_491]